ncbi:MAG: GNAT family N-acetyltransferase [Verrucomicrobia bacterium]|nr:GNAT family N-acetyltransferase [Verrucomicrobiota bacterium]
MYGSPVPIGNFHVVESFDCGKEPLDVFLKKYASQNEVRFLSRTFVIAGRDNRVVGYYTLAAAGVAHEEAPLELKKRLPKYPIPMILLARLAIDRNVQGQGLGAALLKDAFRKAAAVSEIVGARALLVHAKDEEAKAWYKKYGFVASPTDPLHLFLPMETIKGILPP